MPVGYRGNRSRAQSIIEALVQEDVNNAYIMDFLNLNDLGYTPQNMRNDINRIRLENVFTSLIKANNPQDMIPERWMRTWHGETEYQYRVVVKYEYFDTKTLTVKTTGTTLYYDEPPSQAQVMEDWNTRKQTIEATYNSVNEVYGAKQILYFKNV